MTKKYLVPYRDGNLVRQAPYTKTYGGIVYRDTGSIEWRDNTPFPAALEISNLPWGAVDTTCDWVDVATGGMYPMFFTQLAELIYAGAMIKNRVVRGLWDIRKIGNSFGVRLLEAEKVPEPQVITIPNPVARPHPYVWYGTIGGPIEDEGFCHGCYTAACPGCNGHLVKGKE